MKLKLIATIQETPYGWLNSKTKEFYQCGGREYHTTFAVEYLREHNIRSTSDTVYELMAKCGWIRVAYSGDNFFEFAANDKSQWPVIKDFLYDHPELAKFKIHVWFEVEFDSYNFSYVEALEYEFRE